MKSNLLKKLVILLIAGMPGCTSSRMKMADPESPVGYVNPYMGNISHLLVPAYPTIHLPNSMLRVYPERADYTGDRLRGLPLVVTSHRGSSAFNLSPYQGSDENLQPVIAFSYDQEKITPYSYAVYLDDQETEVRFGVSHQSGLYEFTFGKSDSVALIINSLKGEMCWNGKAVSGHQQLQNNVKVYIYLEADLPVRSAGVLKEGMLTGSDYCANGRNACVVLKFAAGSERIRVRYGISFINEEQARKNLEREFTGFELEPLLDYGRMTWNEALGKIKISGGTYDDKTVFYTSLYRTYERPVCISEDGLYYSAFDGKVHEDEGIPFYTDDWIWDTYRATHPLRILTDPGTETRIIRSFLRMAEQMEHFWMPTFPEITGDSRRMNSNHGVATVIDGWSKGIREFDLEKAYEACRKGIEEKTLAPWSGKPAGELDRFYREKGYFPALREGEEETIPEIHSFEKRQPVAVTLGTAYDKWCLSQIARELGKNEDYDYYSEQALNYRHLFNPETRFFHPRDSRGEFIEPFSYVFSGGLGARHYYGENNAWIYRWDVQHCISDLVRLMGGREAFIASLDAMFSEPLGKSKFEFFAQLPDHSGNVGQFSMANEPSLHIPYLYNYAGEPWKTQKRIRALLDQWFRNDLMGIPGDEDGGGMSAFVVFSQLGFYPVTPGLPVYNIGSPAFEESVIRLDNGEEFKIIARNCSKENKYIQSAKLNGKEWNKPWFSHDDLTEGGLLELKMGSKANKTWGADETDAPPSGIVLP